MKYRYNTATLYHEANHLRKTNSALFNKIKELALDAAKDPEYFIGCGREPRNGSKGLGKPERLSGTLAGWYSRRITESDRLVYRVEGGVFVIRSVKGHYTSLNSTSSQLWDSQLDEAFGVL